jgi:flagellar protein FliO/FliZ
MTGSLLYSLFMTLLATAFVLLLAWGGLYALRRSRILEGGKPNDKSLDLRFMRAMPIGPKERLVIVRYRDETLLLGVTAGNINVLRHHPDYDSSIEIVTSDS